MSTPDDIQDLWRRIDAWLIAHDKYALERHLYPPATEQAIAELEALLDVKLPEDYRASLLVHDGTRGGHFGLVNGRWALHSIEDVRTTWGFMKEAFDAGEYNSSHTSVENGPGVKQFWWQPKWIPFATDGGGDYLLLDLDPAEGGQYGQVVRHWRDMEQREAQTPGYGAWLAHFVAELEAGAFAYASSYLERIAGDDEGD